MFSQVGFTYRDENQEMTTPDIYEWWLAANKNDKSFAVKVSRANN